MKEEFDEFLNDSKLHIKTTGRDDRYSNRMTYAYEPTTYTVLKRIAESGLIEKEDVLLDYGCGLGRVPIYMHDSLGCKCIGIEIVPTFFQQTCDNIRQYLKEQSKKAKRKVDDQFLTASCIRAEEYEVPSDVTACFFFNPFDISIMRNVVQRLKASYNLCPRNIKLFIYYPQSEYVAFLSTVPEISFLDEIDCTDLFEPLDERNRVVIYEFI